MLKMLRITDKESEEIRKKSIEINKKLIESGNPPLQDSQLIHCLIELSLERLKVENGVLYLE